MAFVIEMDPPLESTVCYTLSGDVTAYAGGAYEFTVDDGVTTQTIGTISAAGIFTIDFVATANFTEFEFNDLFGADIEALSLNLGTTCLSQLCSECFDLKVNQDFCYDSGMDRAKPSLEIKATNNASIGPLNFSDFNFILHFFISGRIKNANYTYEDIDIFKFSNGEKKMLYADRREIQSMVVDEMPDYMHDVLALVMEMDSVEINGVQYIKTDSDYSPDYANESDNSPVIVELEEKTQTVTNTNCV